MNKETNLNLILRNARQNESRKNYLNSLSIPLASVIEESEFYVSPQREIIIMDLLEKYSKRAVVKREFQGEERVFQFIKNFKRIPVHFEVFVWSALDEGPVYKLNLQWVIDNFEQLWNKFNKYDLAIVSKNGKVGLMVSEYPGFIDDDFVSDKVLYQVKKWGLI
ncbi:hypothetical protein P4679_27165 [Priestia megaterium]|uniref:hypothetical protein n=1 Tax=Priestia megaterium TaxID=1404 RepID=UPI002E215F4B|nr:hypothetical protein [Priestia megaterium]